MSTNNRIMNDMIFFIDAYKIKEWLFCEPTLASCTRSYTSHTSSSTSHSPLSGRYSGSSDSRSASNGSPPSPYSDAGFD